MSLPNLRRKLNLKAMIQISGLRMKDVDSKVLWRVLSIDWISIFLEYPTDGTVSQEFRLKQREGRIEIATRYGDFLPRWHGYVILQKEPVLHLVKLDGKKVNLDVPIPPSDSLRDVFITKETPFGRMMILFTRSFVAQQGGIK